MKSPKVSFFDIFKIIVKRRKITLKKIVNLLRNVLSILFRLNKLTTLPSFLLIDPSNICNLRCPICLELKKNLPAKPSFMEKEAFFKIIDEIADHAMIISLYYAGEPFLNKEIFEMLKYANRKKLFLIISSNFNIKVDEKFAENLVDSGLDLLIIAVSGFTNKIYSHYHSGGNIDIVKSNIKILQEVKRKKIRYILKLA